MLCRSNTVKISLVSDETKTMTYKAANTNTSFALAIVGAKSKVDNVLLRGELGTGGLSFLNETPVTIDDITYKGAVGTAYNVEYGVATDENSNTYSNNSLSISNSDGSVTATFTKPKLTMSVYANKVDGKELLNQSNNPTPRLANFSSTNDDCSIVVKKASAVVSVVSGISTSIYANKDGSFSVVRYSDDSIPTSTISTITVDGTDYVIGKETKTSTTTTTSINQIKLTEYTNSAKKDSEVLIPMYQNTTVNAK